LSERVEAGFLQYLRSWHEQGSPWDLWVEQYEVARGLFARFIGAEPDEVALVASASAGVNSIASALSFEPRRKVVLGEFEFPTLGHIWLAQGKRGADTAFVEAANDRVTVAGYDALIDHDTLIVPLTHICFMNGFRMPTAEITRMAHDRGALVLLDDYQDCGTRPVNVKAMDLDFYVSGTLKYLLGPPGLAFMYVRKSLLRPWCRRSPAGSARPIRLLSMSDCSILRPARGVSSLVLPLFPAFTGRARAFGCCRRLACGWWQLKSRI
jgi:selenocysteine lyase/cysteine desulfurase